MRNPLFAVAAVASLAVTPAFAGHGGAESPYLAAQYLYEISDNARDSADGHGFQLTFGMALPYFEHLEGEVSYADVRRKRDIDGRRDYTSALSFDLVHRLGTFGWLNDAGQPRFPQFKPFVLGGVALVREDARGDSHYHAGFNVGGGTLVDLGFHGLALRTEARVLGQGNRKSVEGRSSLFDYRLMVGLQLPISVFFPTDAGEPPPPPPPACDLAVVDPVTGRVDCDQDSDRDGVPDRLDQCPGTLPGTVVDTHGCPVVMSSEVIRGVNFETASAVLLPESKLILDGTAQVIKGMGDPNLKVEIGGHTDNVGSQPFNLMLSQQRAESVRQYLISKGVDSNQLSAQGYGRAQPVADNETEEGRAQNRRVEFRIVLR